MHVLRHDRGFRSLEGLLPERDRGDRAGAMVVWMLGFTEAFTPMFADGTPEMLTPTDRPREKPSPTPRPEDTSIWQPICNPCST
ncbi:hypothetical protein N806_04535 [Rhodococcus sp. P27]|nr:hypothetical protein N806_04535 [Rhodococcus sp. P27]